MLDRLKALKKQMGCTFWVALVLIAAVLILIAVGIVRLVWPLAGGGAPEVVPTIPALPGVGVESRPMEVPAGVAVIGMDPAWQRIGPGGTTEVAIRIENVTRLYGAEVHLAFDPNYLEIQDADPEKPGVQIQAGTFPAPDFVVQNQVDNVQGTLDYAITQMAPRPPIDGGGVLATITVKTKGEGTSRFAFTGVKLANPDGEQIPVETLGGEIVAVVGAVSVPPTPAIEGPPTATPIVLATPLPTPELTVVLSPTEATPTATVEPTGPPSPTAPVSPTPVQVTPAATPPPPTVIGGCYYVVCRGDTLFSIARRFGTTIAAIAQANGLSDPRYIRAGQRLLIPGACPACVPCPTTLGGTIYIVQRGDTLYSIARRYHTTVAAIAWANGIADPRRIWVGQRLVIPAGCW